MVLCLSFIRGRPTSGEPVLDVGDLISDPPQTLAKQAQAGLISMPSRAKREGNMQPAATHVLSLLHHLLFHSPHHIFPSYLVTAAERILFLKLVEPVYFPSLRLLSDRQT